MQKLEDRIFNARKTKEAVWIVCETDAEKQMFVDWVVAHHPGVLLTFAEDTCLHSAYAYLADQMWGTDGIIDKVTNADRLNPFWMQMSFADWCAEVGLIAEDDDIDCDLDNLL